MGERMEHKVSAGPPNKKEDDEIITITISAAGDCILGSSERYPYLNSFNHEFNKANKDYSFFLKNVRPIFEKDDLTIVNLENPLTNAIKKEHKRYRFKGDPSYVNILKEGSVEVVNIVNNHMHDYLKAGYLDTIKILEKAGIKYYGSDIFYTTNPHIGYLNYEFRLITSVKGINIGLLGYKIWPDFSDVRKKIKDDLEIMKKFTDLIIVSFHWGKEFKNYPLLSQKNLAHFVIDNGANLILGHHPHVIQGIESYKNKNIVYSLGNFCFGGLFNPRDKDTFIYQHSFTLRNHNLIKETSKVIPCSISSVKERNNYQPTPLHGEEKKRVLKRIQEYSKNL